MTTKTKTKTKTAPKTPPEPVDADDRPSVPDLYRRLTQGDKLRLGNALGVSFAAVGLGSPEYMVAVAWKHRQMSTGQVKIADLLDMTDDELLDVLGLTADEIAEQFREYAEAQGAGAPQQD